VQSVVLEVKGQLPLVAIEVVRAPLPPGEHQAWSTQRGKRGKSHLVQRLTLSNTRAKTRARSPKALRALGVNNVSILSERFLLLKESTLKKGDQP